MKGSCDSLTGTEIITYLQSLHCEPLLAIISLVLINRQVICFRESYTTSFLLSCQSLSISSYFRHFYCFILAICSFLFVQFSFVWNHCKKKLASSITFCTAQIHSYFLFMTLVFVCLHGGMPVCVSLLVVNRNVLRGKSLNKLMGGKGMRKGDVNYLMNQWAPKLRNLLLMYLAKQSVSRKYHQLL